MVYNWYFKTLLAVNPIKYVDITTNYSEFEVKLGSLKIYLCLAIIFGEATGSNKLAIG